MNINIDNLNKNSLIMQWNVDTNGNPASVRIENEVHQISTTHNLIQLAQIPDDYYKVQVGVDGETDWLREVYNRDEIEYDTYYVDYGLGYVYFDKVHQGKAVIANYYGRGVILLSDSRIFHKTGDTFVDTWDNIMERSKDSLDLLESAGGLTNAIKVIDQKVEQGNQVADRIEGFIEETEFYGYTILLSREAFVIKAKEDGNVETSEYGDIYTDVVVYKGATQVTTPDLKLSLTNQTNCEFEIVGQRIKLKTGSMKADTIKGQATVVIDCGDGLIAQRIIEVTKVFDGVSQYQVEIGNSFYSFNANSDGTIEEEQSVTCDINVTKANELYESYTVSIQNMPKGLTHNIVNGTKTNRVTFTATAGESLPDNGSVSIIVQMADNIVISKTFSFGKTKQGVDAKSLILTGNQIVKYDTPDYTDTPSPYRSIINAQASGLSGTPNWYVLNENNEWDLIVGQTGTTLEVYHNDSVIWKDRKETTIKCELDGYSDEITLIKIANGATGSDAYSILLSNEATSIPTDEEGNAPTNEVQKQYTAISVYRGTETVSPTKIEVVGDVEESYRATVVGNEVHLKSISNEVGTVRIPINITVDGLVFQRVWTISKSKQGSVGQSGSTLILNIEGGTRSIAYNQMNVNPRPITSASFTARLYENGVEVLEGVGYYWSCVGHVRGTSTTRTFTPTIIDTYDESMLSNQITVTTTYKGNTISNTVPIAITKDVSGIDWVTDWDSRKVSIRDTEVLTPKIFAGTYNQVSDSVTGVAIGQDVLNDGQTIGIVAYQDNTPTLMVGVDGSIEIGDPYQNRHQDGVGIGYNNGQFVGRFSQLTIAGVDVPTEEVINDKINQAVSDAQNQLKAEVEEVNSALVDLNDYVSNAVRDGILDEVEKGKIDNLMQIVKQEVTDVEGQYTSIRTNQYLTDGAVIEALDLAYAEYKNAYNEVNTKYNGLVASGSETGEIAGMVTTGDTSYPIGNGEVATEIPEGGTDDSGLLIDKVPIIGEDDIVDSGGVYPQLTVSNIDEFMLALDNFRISSNSLYQVMNQALTSISESQATQISEKAKEEVIREVNDVSDALAGLEDTMNGEFKTGLIGQMNLANLRERLKQLDIEKKDIDGQYSVMSTHSALDTTTKNKLVSAKGKLDSAHTQLVTKINAVISDNLLTSAELEEVNNLIVAYSTALGEYSKVAQEANIAIAVNSAKNAVEAITDEDVFNKVTNFGKTQGLFIENGGKVYINAQYIQTRGFVATKDDGTKTFEIDKNGNVNIIANSFTLTGQGNVATEDYVNSAIEGIVNKNISFSLSNEFQIIPTNATYYPFETQSYVVQIYGYKGSEEITNFTIGTVTSTNAIKAVVSNVNRSVTFTVTPNTSLGTTHGYIDIPITYEGKSYNKRWSWAVAKQGDLAPQISITGEQVFKYTNNFTGTPTPASIVLTADVYNTTVTGKWQYLNSSSWVDCNVTAKTLSLQPTSYTLSSLKRVTVRYIVEEVFDTFTVVAISDGANGVDGQDGANGQDGADGKGIASITEQYYHSTSMTTQTGGSWSTTVPTATRGKYIWTRSVIKYTDSTTTTTTPICVSGSDGANGNNGADGTNGIGITSVDVEYAQNTSTTTAPTSGWTTTSPTWANGKYIWSRTKTTYSNGKVTYTNPACITGQKGDTGASGKGIKSITQYYLATSLSTGVTTSTSGWSTGIPTMTTTNKYLWNYETIAYTDSSSTTTTPAIIGVHGTNGTNGSNGVGIKSITEYYLATSSSSGVTTSTSGWTTTIQTPSASKKYLWNYEIVTYTDNNKYTGTPRIIGNYATDGQNGADAITIVLTNENHTFSANSSGNITSTQSTTTNITAYKGANTTSVTIGTLPTVTGLTLSKSGSTVTIKANTGTSLADTGTFSIPLTIDGKSFTKNFSWTKVKAGATGATGSAGASAKAVDIIASSQVFKSTDGGTTFSPSTIKLTPKLQNLTYSNWQYSTNGGSSWTTVSSGSNGLTISSGVLTISKDSALYTSSVTSVSFRVNTNDSAYYDVVTIVKLYDVGDISVGSRNYLLNSNFAKTTTLGGTTNKNPNLYANDWGGYNGGISNPTTNYHAHIDNTTFGYNVVEYNETDGTRHWKGISQGSIQNRIKGVKEFTISMDVYATASGTKTWGGFYYTKIGGTTQNFHAGRFSISSDKISVGKWSRVSAKVPMGTDVDFSKPISFYIYGYGFTSNAILYIKDVVLTQGNTMSDWTPAPEDVDSNIQGAITESKEYTNSQIKATKDAIELSVSSTYETKTNVSSKISSTLTSAKSYADTKKSEAISTASSDATSKANNALTNAKSYADTKKSEAITSANNTLNTTIANYYTKTQTDSAIKVAKDSVTTQVGKVEEIASSSLQGKMLYTDPTFTSGVNNMLLYNNAGNGTVTLTRITKSSDCPTTSGYMIQIKTTGTASPSHGGFYFATQTRNNAIFVTKIIAKIPSGYTLNFATNGIGTGGSHKWLTANSGTGNWKEYVYKVTCGNGGTLSSTNFFYLSGGSTATTSSPVTWYVAMATTFDITATDNLEKRMNTAEQKITDSAIVSTVTSSKTYTDAMTGKVSKTEVISSINQTAESVKINASKIALTGDVVINAINGTTSTSISGNKIKTGTIQGTNFIAGGSSNNGYVEVLDSSNNLIFKAQKGGVVSRKITFVNDVNSGFGNSIPIVTSIDQEGINMGYDAYSISDSEGFRTRYTKETKYASDEVAMNYEVRTENSSTGSASYMREENMTLNPKGVAFNVFGDYDGGSVAIGLYKKGASLSEGVRPLGSTSGYTYQAGIQVPYMESLVIGNFLTDMEGGVGYSSDNTKPLGAGMANIYAEIGDEWTKLYRQLRFELGGGTDTANVWNQEQYNTTGNGQMLTYSAGKVFVSNPKTPLVLESSVTPSVKVGSNTYSLYHTGSKPSVIDSKGALSNAEYGRNVHDTGIYTYNLHNNSLINGDSSWSAYAGYWSVLSWGRGTAGSAQLAIDWTSGGKGFYMRSLRDTSDNWWTWKRIPNDQWTQTSTSDIRYKEVMSDVDLDDCYNMVKNIGLHSYLLLDEEDRHTEGFDAELAFLQATQEEGISRKLQMGVIAQEMLDYKCADFVVVQDVLKGKDGEVLSDRYSIDAYNYASAILGGLQKEIQIRDEQYEELKQENKELKAKVDSLEQRLAKLEALLGQE